MLWEASLFGMIEPFMVSKASVKSNQNGENEFIIVEGLVVFARWVICVYLFGCFIFVF